MKPETMLVCQSRQVPMKSKRRALGRGLGGVVVDILGVEVLNSDGVEFQNLQGSVGTLCTSGL